MSKNWPSPRSNYFQPHSTGAKATRSKLNHESVQWSTPRASDSEKGGPNQQFSAGGTPLPAQSVQWATPTSRDWKDGSNPSDSVETNSLLGRQAPRTIPAGPISSFLAVWTSCRLSLNPFFVEWLMGLPCAWINCAPSEMESYLSKQRMRLQSLLDL
jgi:hypothetical protein